nr:hypothetical protein [Tanacetum cinerariifolium]
MTLQPHSSRVKIQTSCSIDKDKYMMKAQAHMSKSSAISDVQALPQKEHYRQDCRTITKKYLTSGSSTTPSIMWCSWCGGPFNSGNCRHCTHREQMANLPHQEISIQDMEDLKQYYLDKMKSMINQIQIKDYRNEKIDIRYRRECEVMFDEFKESTFPLNETISQIPPSIAITPVLPTMKPEDSLIIRNEELSTILEKESNELIKSSVEDFVQILSESEDTFGSDSECDLPSCDDFFPINVLEGNSVTFYNPLFDSNDDFSSSDDESLSDEDVREDNVKIYSNPLFEFNDKYISSDVNPLCNEVLENIENNDSYDSNLDEPNLLVTPLSDANEDVCFDPGGDINEIDAFDIPSDFEDGYYDSEVDVLYPEEFLDCDPKSLKIPHGEIKVRIEAFSMLWGNRLLIPDGSLPLSRLLKNHRT